MIETSKSLHIEKKVESGDWKTTAMELPANDLAQSFEICDTRIVGDFRGSLGAPLVATSATLFWYIICCCTYGFNAGLAAMWLKR